MGGQGDFQTRWFVPFAIYRGWGGKLSANRTMNHVTYLRGSWDCKKHFPSCRQAIWLYHLQTGDTQYCCLHLLDKDLILKSLMASFTITGLRKRAMCLHNIWTPGCASKHCHNITMRNNDIKQEDCCLWRCISNGYKTYFELHACPHFSKSFSYFLCNFII